MYLYLRKLSSFWHFWHHPYDAQLEYLRRVNRTAGGSKYRLSQDAMHKVTILHRAMYVYNNMGLFVYHCWCQDLIYKLIIFHCATYAATWVYFCSTVPLMSRFNVYADNITSRNVYSNMGFTVYPTYPWEFAMHTICQGWFYMKAHS